MFGQTRLGCQFPRMFGYVGSILGFSALTWVVAHAVFAPGRTTVQRVQGAVVVNLAMILNPAAFNNAIAPGRSGELGTMFISTLLR